MPTPLEKYIAEVSQAQAAVLETEVRALAPFAGRLDCRLCHGAGGYIEVRPGAEVAINSFPTGVYRLSKVVHRCTCTTIGEEGGDGGRLAILRSRM